MSFKNTFETQAKEYLGIQGGVTQGKATTIISADILEVGDVPGRHVQLGADSGDVAYIDFKSKDGVTSTDWDARIISQGGTGWNGGAFVNVQSQAFSVPYMRSFKYQSNVVGGVAPFFLLDYGDVVVATGTNAITTITFTANLFNLAPKVILTVVDDGTGVQVDNFTTYIISTTPTQCQVTGYGNVAGDFKYNWLALGI